MSSKPELISDRGRYVFYFRVSTKKQGESGLGLDAQRTYIEHFYGAYTDVSRSSNGKKVIGEFTETMSGKDVVSRPELKKAIALCKKENATLVVAKIDRLSRNTEDALMIYRELDGRLESCDIPNLDKFTLTLFMAIADRERELIGIRTKAALVEKRKRIGEWRQASLPFKDKTAVVKSGEVIKSKAKGNENNKRAAALIRSYREKGMNWLTIAGELNNAGFKTSRGKTFQAIQVQRIFNQS
jgi:DNA invertase Pin-like site-specific DNA recombinase